jgi:hypothetical protein
MGVQCLRVKNRMPIQPCSQRIAQLRQLVREVQHLERLFQIRQKIRMGQKNCQ